MISHLFALKAENLSPRDRMANVAERLYDMGYRYDYVTNSRQFNAIASQAKLPSLCLFSEGNIIPYEVSYVTPSAASADNLVRRRAIVTRSESGDLLPESSIVFLAESAPDDASFANLDSLQAEMLEQTTVADFLAQKHPHPIKSSLERMIVDLRQLVGA